MTTPPNNKNMRILVIKMSSLGDLFHALPAVHAVRRYDNAAVDWVTQPEYREIVECFTDVDHVFAYPRRRFLTRAVPFIRRLREHSYDLVLDFQGLLKSAMVLSWARGARKIGPSYQREGARLLYGEVAGSYNKNRHAVEEALDIARHLGVKADAPVFPVRFPPYKTDAPHPRIALIPCSRWPTKNWPAEHFQALAHQLQQLLHASVFILGAQQDRPTCDRIAQALDAPVYNMAGQTSLTVMGGLLQQMDLAVSVDSGPMHMAAAAGTPVLALFGPTDPVRTGPYGQEHRVLNAPRTPCWPCRKRTCPVCRQAMRELTPEMVFEASRAMLDHAGRPSPEGLAP
jgi:lipopolysaccharide heptosyltransferase I